MTTTISATSITLSTTSNETSTTATISRTTMTDNNGFCSPATGSKIFLSVCPLLLAFGTCTNVFSLLVLTRKRMRKHSTYVFLAILSVIDMLALYLGLIRDYLAHGYGIYINAPWLCKLHAFLFYYTLDFTSWILVAVSIDRFLAITFVFSSYTRQMLLKLLAKPKLICFIIGISLFFLNLHFFFYIEVLETSTSTPIHTPTTPTPPISSSLNSITTSIIKSLSNSTIQNRGFTSPFKSASKIASTTTTPLVENSEIKQASVEYFSIGVSKEYENCVINERKHPIYAKFFLNTWPYIDLSVYAILPFCIMSVCNIAIIKNAKFSTQSASSSSGNGGIGRDASVNSLSPLQIIKNCWCCCICKSKKLPFVRKREVRGRPRVKQYNTTTRDRAPNNIRGGAMVNLDQDDNSTEGISCHNHNSTNNITDSNKPTTIVFNAGTISLSNQNCNQSRNIKMMTLTIISITCIFIVLTLPVMLFIVFDKIASSTAEMANGNKNAYVPMSAFLLIDPNCKAIIWSIVNIFMYVNHSINFVLYCLTGSKFRTELATLFVSESSFSTTFRNFSSIRRYSSIKIPSSRKERRKIESS